MSFHGILAGKLAGASLTGPIILLALTLFSLAFAILHPLNIPTANRHRI